MITRRTIIGSAAAAGLLSTLPAHAQTKTPVVGKDYTVVRPPLDFPPRPIVIHDFFAYTCPHCLQFEPNMSEWIAEHSKDADIRVVPVPVAWNESYEIFPRTYFSFEAMGRMHDLHHAFWEWTIKEKHDWNTTDDVQRDIFKWVGDNGGDLAVFQRHLRSFSTANKARQATMTWRYYGVDSTPSIGIAGRFITAPHLVGTRRGTIEVLDALVEQIRKER